MGRHSHRQQDIRRCHRSGHSGSTFWGLGSAVLFLAPAVALLSDRTEWAEVSTSAWLSVGYMALCSSFVGYIAWFWALGRGAESLVFP